MKTIQKNIALGLVNLIMMNSTLGVMSVYASTPVVASVPVVDNSALLLNDVKTLKAAIDSGSSSPATAVDAFSSAITTQNVSIDDVNAFVQTQMTDAQFATYQSSINASLNGIDPSTLKPDEVGQIVGQAVSQVQTTGLYWNGCADVWTGAAIIAAAVIAGVFAIVKSRSAASIQSEYNAKIAQQQTDTANSVTQTQTQYANNITNTTNSYNKQISDTNNWQTAFPADIASENQSISSANGNIQSAQSSISTLNNEISSEESTASQYQYSYQSEINTNPQQASIDESYYESAENSISSYQNQINSDNQTISNNYADISSYQQAIANYNSKIATYTANPAQAPIDAAALAVARDAAIADLQTQEPIAIQTIQTDGANAVTALQTTENQKVAAVPANQALATKLAIGGGIGAAIGAGLLIYGIRTNDCGSND